MAAVVSLENPNEARLVPLSSSPGARSYLGALADTKGGVHAWLELWVQEVAPGDAADLRRGPQTNPELDSQWKTWVDSATALHEASILWTGFELSAAPPVWLDARELRCVVPRDSESGALYELCRDDGRLSLAGLETYSESNRRYLYIKDNPRAGLLSADGVSDGSARSPLEALPKDGRPLLAFNPSGGYLLVRRLAPLSWGQVVALLSGRPVRGLAAGQTQVKLGGAYSGLDDWEQIQKGGGYLFSTGRGRAGRVHETFHLKLAFFASMLRSLRTFTATSRAPHFRLSADAFRADLLSASELPSMWTLRPVIEEPPVAVRVAVPGDLSYFQSRVTIGRSAYRPEAVGRALEGKGELRIRRVIASGDRTVVEATMVSSELAFASPRDLVWTRAPLPGLGSVPLVGNIDAGEALARGEARFRTAPLELTPPVVAGLQRAEGSVFAGTSFSTIPLLSAPVDLWALGVLGVELFLCGGGKPVPEALDELLSLARSVPAGPAKLGERVRSFVEADSRWLGSLGPQHHGHELSGVEEAAAAIPLELWWDLVAHLSRFFAGIGAEAYARDFGDAPSLQLEAFYDRVVADTEVIVLRSRSLLLCDWPSNRELARVIQQVR